MSYEQTIHAFYDQLETNPLTSSAIALWHSLVHISNKHGLAKGFTVAASVLCMKAGLKERTFYKARNELKTKGYIDYKSRSGNQAAIYQLLSLSANNADNHVGKTHLPANNADSCADNHAGSHAGSHAGNRADSCAVLNRLTDRKNDRLTDRVHEPKKPTWGDIVELWREVFDFDLRPNHAEMLGSYIDQDGMEESLVLEAIERVRNSDKRVMQYLWRTLSNWAKAGIKTIPDLVQHEKQRVPVQQSFSKQPKKKNDSLTAIEEYKRKHGVG
ncbi:DnaD domain protein [Bacillus tianshenii]|nr:DnaD domain protein [Bacillus tianshenii]